MHPPHEWTKKWAYDHPWQASLVLLCAAVLIGFTVWIALN